MLEKQRDLIGTIGCRALFLLAIPIHVATVAVAFHWYGGIAGVMAALISGFVPVLPEVYWAIRIGMAHGSIWHWYVIAVTAYPIVWLIFIVGGLIFDPRKKGGKTGGW